MPLSLQFCPCFDILIHSFPWQPMLCSIEPIMSGNSSHKNKSDNQAAKFASKAWVKKTTGEANA